MQEDACLGYNRRNGACVDSCLKLRPFARHMEQTRHRAQDDMVPLAGLACAQQTAVRRVRLKEFANGHFVFKVPVERGVSLSPDVLKSELCQDAAQVPGGIAGS